MSARVTRIKSHPACATEFRDNPERIETRAATAGVPRAETMLLTARDLEALLKIDVKTIYSYVRRGLIPYVRIQSNVRFVKQQILDWIEERNYRPRPLSGR